MEPLETDSFTDYVPGGNMNKGLYKDMMSIIAKYDRPFPESDIVNLNNLSVSHETGFLEKLPVRGCFGLDDDEEWPHHSEKDVLSATALDDFMGGIIAEETRLAEEEEELEDIEEEEEERDEGEDTSSVENASVVSGAVLKSDRCTELSEVCKDSEVGGNGDNVTNQLNVSENLQDKYGGFPEEVPLSRWENSVEGVGDLMEDASSGTGDEFTDSMITGIQEFPDGGREVDQPQKGPSKNGMNPVFDVRQVSRSRPSSLGTSHMPQKRHRRALLFHREGKLPASTIEGVKNSFSEESGVDLEDIEDRTLCGRYSDEPSGVAAAPIGLPGRCSDAEQMEKVRLWLLGKRKREAAPDDLDTSSPQKSSRITLGYTELLSEDPLQTTRGGQSSRHSLPRGSPRTPRSLPRGRVAGEDVVSRLLSPVHSVIRSSPRQQRGTDPMSVSSSREADFRHQSHPESPSSRRLLETWKMQMNFTPKGKTRPVTVPRSRETFIVSSTEVSSIDRPNITTVKDVQLIPEDDEGISTMTTVLDTTKDRQIDSQDNYYEKNGSNMPEIRCPSGKGNQRSLQNQPLGKSPIDSEDGFEEDHDKDKTIVPEFNKTYVIRDRPKKTCNISPGKKFLSQPFRSKISVYKPWVSKRKGTPKSARNSRGVLKQQFVSAANGDKTLVGCNNDALGFTGDPFEFLEGDSIPDSFKPCHNSTMIPKHHAPVTNGQISQRMNKHGKEPKEVVPAGGRHKRSRKVRSRTMERHLKTENINETRTVSSRNDVVLLGYDVEDSPSNKEKTTTTIRSSSVSSPSRSCGGRGNCEKVFCLKCCDSPVK